MLQPDRDDLEGRLARIEQQSERLSGLMELLARREAAPPARNWDAYAALIAAFIGFVAVMIAGYTAYVERQQLRAQVWPRLELWYSSKEVRFAVSNRGTGPARVTAMRVTVAGRPVKTWWDARDAAGIEADSMTVSHLTGRVLSPDQEVTLSQLVNDESSRAKFGELLPGGRLPVVITVCYCSVLADCWVVVSDDSPADVEPSECPIPAEERFGQ